jgi:peptidoglycan/xylan/chitin deacetylase (PgdA/CDA1 family)
VRDVLVLCYHGVSDSWPSWLAVSPERLERQLAMLVRRGYRGATFEQAVTAPPFARTLAVTFDDGYRSVLTRALPVLERLGLPGSVYAATDFVGTSAPMSWPGIDEWVGGPHEDELVSMSWDQLRSLRDAGWEVGSHTCSHPRLSRLDDAALERELAASRRICEEQLGACRTVALPYGDGDARTAPAALAAGYRVVAGLPGADAAATVGWPRVGVYPFDGPGRFRLKVSAPMRRPRVSRAVQRLEAAAGGPLALTSRRGR